MEWRFAVVLLILCELSAAQVFQQDPIPTFTVGTRYPNLEEDEQCRPIKLRLIRNSARFTATLVRNTNSELTYANEDARFMTSRLKFRLDTLAQWYYSTYSARLTVQLSYADPNSNTVTDRNNSLHYEGRSVRVNGTSSSHLPDILNHAILFGFDWVIYADITYCRLSVIPDMCQTNLDLLFLLDQSGSVGRTNHNLALQFIKAVVNFFEVGDNNTRVAVFTFGTGARADILFNPSLTTRQVVSYIGLIPYRGGWTHTALALNLARSAFTYPDLSGARPIEAGVPRIVVLITDGRSNTFSITQPAINLLATGATVYSIGVGNVYIPELNQIATDPDSDHVFLLNSYTDAAAFVQLLSGTTCDTPANIPPGEEPENEVGEDDFKYFQVQCGTFSTQIIIEQIDIIGNCYIYVSLTVINPGPLNSNTEVLRNETINVTRRTLIITVGIGQNVYISIRGITVINRFRMVVWNMLFSEEEYCVEVPSGTSIGEEVIDLDIINGTDSLYSFSIIEGNSAGRFEIDEMTGAITTTESLVATQQSYYELNVVASLRSDDCQRGRTIVKVTVTTENLNPPVFQATSPVSILETVPINSEVVQVNATDPDFGANSEVRYFITGGNNGNMFAIDSVTGVITTAARLNHTLTPSYNLTIEARDQATIMPMTGTASQVINVEDVNQRPFFLTECAILNTCLFFVPENATLGNIGEQVEAGDPDSAMLQNGQVTYALNPSTPFSISSSGEIILTSSLDRETQDNYFINLTVTDGGTPPLGIATSVTITVTDINDNRPVLTVAPTIISVAESTQVGVVIAQVSSNDSDIGNNRIVTYSINGSLFAIDAQTGAISVAESLDYETATLHTVVVTGTNPDGLASSPLFIMIMVTNVNDNSPMFAMDRYTASVLEGSSINTIVTTVTATDDDLDLAGEVRYTIVSGNVNDAFAISRSSGVITVNSDIDREVISEYALTVRARDRMRPRRSDTTVVIITVIDVNDNAPVFQRSQYSLIIHEVVNVPSIKLTLVATDADQPGTNNSAIRYHIESGNIGMVFNLSETTGDLMLQSSLDFETLSSYSLVVIASDSGLVPLSGNATVSVTVVNVNDEVPTLSGDQNISLPESTVVQTVVASFTAMEEMGDILEFTLTGSQNGEFSINVSTGVVTLVQSLDYETTQQFVLTVTVSDGLFSDTSILTINVIDENDNSPVFVAFGPFMIDEEEPSNTLVGVVSASDADSGMNAEISYSSSSGSSMFNISSDGEVRSTAVLDREVLGSDLSFTVVATDNGIPQLSSQVTIAIQLQDINDNRPMLVSPPSEVNISESEPTQTVVAMIQATDGDIGVNAVISYQINGSSLFTIDSSTGTIILTASLDYETATEHVINVTAVNPDGLSSLVHTILIQVLNENDNLPVFTMDPYIANVTEDSDIGTLVVSVTATDADLSAVRYSIVSGNVGGVFAIDAISGMITVNGSIDRETISEYVLTISATDLGLMSRRKRQLPPSTVTADVRITVSDINDNAPVFLQSPYSVTLREDVSLGMIRLLMVADADEPNTPNSMIILNIEAGNEAGKFTLDNSGSLSLIQELDFETQNMFVLTVSAQDQGDPPLSSDNTTVTITVTNVNDLSPVISESQVVDVSELQPLGSSLIIFNATGEEGESLTFSLTDSTGTFEIDSQTGNVTLARSLDYEIRTIYIVQVSVSDGLFTNTSTLTVNVLDENDNDPQIAPLGPLSVNEEMQAGTLVGTVTAFDADSGINAQLTFEISPAIINDYISINSSTREIRTANILDREELVNNGRFILPSSSETFNITVTDGGSPARSAQLEVVLILKDINDNPPVFSNLPGKVNVSESSAVGFEILEVVATDADIGMNAQLEFYITDNDTAFTIDSVTGILSLSSVLDYETAEQHIVNISVTDGLHVTSSLLTVNVLDENDNSPVFNRSVYNAMVVENSPIGATVAIVQATDADSHMGPFGSIFYTLQGGGSEFTIAEGTGEITVNTTDLDRETVSLHTLTVVATDYGVPSRSSIASVVVTITDVNDNNPQFQQLLYRSNIREDAPLGAEVITVLATDADEPGNNNSVIDYSLDDISVFNISSDGTIKLVSVLNFEMTSTYTLTVTARDRGMPSLTGEASVVINVINVNDEPPMLSGNQSQSLNLSEFTPVLTRIIQYTVVGESSNESITYSLNGSQSDDFSINSTTGAVTLVQSLDYEITPFYSLNVFVDDGRFVSTSQLNITVLDENDNVPEFDPVGVLQITEESPNGTFVGQVTATDADSGVNQLLTYSFVQASIAALFSIDGTTGIITTAVVLDREALVQQNMFLPPESQITFQVQATDGGTPSLFSQMDVTVRLTDINDNAPVFVNPVSTVDVSESAPVGESIVTITATDADIGENAMIVYSLTGSSLFYINASTGEIFLNGTLDFETVDEYNVTITAANPDGLQSTTHPLQIRVTDENDNSPMFSADSYNAMVAENSPVGTFVVNVSAIDADSGMLGEVHYFIVGGNDDDLFSIDALSGTITVNNNIDREAVSNISLTVRAVDLGSPPRSTTVMVFINVTDVNDNAPIFNPLTYEMNVSESATVSMLVLTVMATDADVMSPNNQITYSLVGTDGNSFSIAQNGDISLVSALDFETQEVHSFFALAVDGGNPSLTGTAEIVITVLNENDLPPVLTGDSVVSILESTSVGSRIARFTATGEEGETLTFSLNVSSPFIIDQTGVISVNETLDFETTMFYYLLVTVSDGVFNASSPLRVDILDVNDNAPQIIAGPFELEEEIPVNSSVGTVVITDADSGVNAEVTCMLIQPENRRFFTIDSDCSEVFTAARIDRESIDTFNSQPNITITIMLQVTDNGDPALSTVRDVEFVIIGINDNAPVFVNPTASTDLEESTPVGEMVAEVSATDADIGNDPIVYTITESSFMSRSSDGTITETTGIVGSSLFAVNSSTGVITLISSLDYEMAIEHTIFISAANPDGLESNRSATRIFTVVNENDNSPVFIMDPYNAFVLEASDSGTFVVTVLANDADLGMPGEVFYSILTGNVGDAFMINTSTGVVAVNGDIDREQTSIFELVVVATDRGIPSRSSQSSVIITIGDINDNPPVFDPMSYSVTVFENVSINSLLTTVNATDADIPPNSNITYSITTGDELFNISQDGSLFTASTLDFETSTNHMVIVQAANDESDLVLSSSAMVIISVLDVNDEEPVLDGNTNVTISELASINSMVSRFTVQNIEVGDNITFELSGNMSEMFSIDPLTGLVAVALSLDFEMTQSYDLLVTVNDGIFTNTIELQVNVEDENDNSPFFEEFGPFDVMEELPIGSLVGTVVASDEDSGVNSILNYTISVNVLDLFTINSETGEILTAMVLDRESLVDMNLFTPPTSSESITVEVEDNGSPSLASQVMVSIMLIDINDNIPLFEEFEQNLTFPENIQNGTVIVEVIATDADLGENGAVTYSITSDEPLPFDIDSVTGVVTTIETLDRETVDFYMFEIVASDNGVVIQSSSIEVTVDVSDVNDNPPVFNVTLYTIEIPENTAADGVVAFTLLTLRTTDADIGVNAQVTYSLAPGTLSGFEVRPSGEFRVSASIINFEGQNEFNVTVIATDGGLPALTANAVVNIIISNVDEFAPVFDGPCDANVSEDTSINTVVTRCTATDRDGGELFYQTFSLSVSNIFNVDFDTGNVTLLQSLDRETTDQYLFTVEAGTLLSEDPTEVDETSSLLTKMDVTITVTDVNDNAPMFNPSVYEVSVDERTVEMFTPGPIPVVLNATDDDINENGQFSIYLDTSLCDLPAPDNGSTVVDVINVTAEDMGSPSMTGLATVIVTRSCVLECALDGSTILFYGLCSQLALASRNFIFGTPVQLDGSVITNVPVTYQWYLNGTSITNQSSNPILDLGEMDFDDVGLYYCIARTRLGNLQTNTANIGVHTMPVIERPPEDIAVESGRVVVFRCFTSGVPSPDITFYHNDAEVVTNDPRFIHGVSSLVITDVTTSDQGIYYCEASNVVGTVRSSAATLIVFGLTELVTISLSIDNPNEAGTCHNLDVNLIESILESSTNYSVDVNHTFPVNGEFCEPNSCYPNPCQNNGSCFVNDNATNGYVCECPVTYAGVSCQDDVDECLSDDPCLFGNCSNIPGLFECACSAGSEGHRCQYFTRCNDTSLCGVGETCVETVANALGYVCVSTPVEDRLHVQLSDDVTINRINEALYDLTDSLLALDPNSTDVCEPRFISVDGITTLTLVWGCPNGTDPLGIVAEDLICNDFLSASLVEMCVLSDGSVQQPPEITLEPASVLVTFILMDPETNRTLSAVEAITVLQRSRAQSALLSGGVEISSSFEPFMQDSPPTEDVDDGDGDSGGLSGGATAGVIIAVLLVVVVLTLLGIYVGYKYYTKNIKDGVSESKTVLALKGDVEGGINQRTQTVTGMFENRAFGKKPSAGADTVFENPAFTDDAPVITKLEGNTEPITKSAITRIASEETRPSVNSETGLLS